jgi:Tol biopolymer transport system component
MRLKSFKTLTRLIVLILAGCTFARENVRKELAHSQKETGFALTCYYSGVFTLQFADRSVSTDKGPPPAGRLENALLSPDGSEIAFPAGGIEYLNMPHLTIVRRDGSVVHEYAKLADARAVCWSHDGSKLVVHAKTAEARPPQYHLIILDVASASIRQFGDADSYATNQCWSSDDRQIVYGTKGKEEVQVYDIKKGSSQKLGHGASPTWSADGQRIAIREGDGYYIISSSGDERKQLFKTNSGRGQLWWSPDSRIVAYLSEGGTFWQELQVLDVGLLQIRVRRLADGSEDWVYQIPNVPPAWSLGCQWLKAGDKRAPRESISE